MKHDEWENWVASSFAGTSTGIASSDAYRPPFTPKGRVVQFISDLVFGDAVAGECIAFHRTFERWGWESATFCARHDQRYASIGRDAAGYTPEASDIILFHYSGWSRAAERLLGLQLPMVMRYHNITPLHFLAEEDALAAESVRRGLAALPEFARFVVLGVGVSEFNRRALAAAGFERTTTLPYRVDFARLEQPPSARGEILRRAPYRLIMVGRVVPNKCQHEAVAVLAALRQSLPGAVLSFVGAHDQTGPYCTWIQMLADRLGVSGAAQFHGLVPDEDLIAFYRSADAFLSLSEHEGFCVPLVEAMHFGVPIVAYASSAVPDTLGNAGVLVHRKDPAVIAALLGEIHGNLQLRSRLVSQGFERARAFGPDILDPRLAELIEEAERLVS